jgi:hypothetical protein
MDRKTFVTEIPTVVCGNTDSYLLDHHLLLLESMISNLTSVITIVQLLKETNEENDEEM